MNSESQMPWPVVAYFLRANGKRLDPEAIQNTACDAWLWVGRDGHRGPTPFARLAATAELALDPRAPCIEALDDAQVLARRQDGVLVAGYIIELSRARDWQQRRQTWWCVHRPLYRS